MSGHPDGSPRHGYRFRTGVHAEIDDGGRTIACEAVNLSRSGALLVGDFEAPPGDTVDFAIIFPTGRLTVHLSGRIIRVEPNSSGDELRVALEFVDMDDSRREALEVLLARLLETPTAGSLDGLKPGATPREIKTALDAIPLPQRIALSSRATLSEREFLRSDTHPAVLEALVRNPGLTVEEARVLASSVHLVSGTLDALANDLRFKSDEAVCIAVASHPRVSLATAEKVIADFKVPQIKKLLAKPCLGKALRDKLFKRTQR